ncbi:hypothetical protein BU14_0366s0004 [Porphyra umbilicalis]|uniref:Secreted protein n=1 Tax=Porphyra umbilicalis TaxID=2786 RepID=A0A1X6NX55_PORUM|nr:hypothetical protein BU14_0366s0004 [Porphyra umbilicalis]|eukprot:OSX73229.1 hypothetical protein BU14_0366s0004 [Porphyra umbilicalis]
MLLVAVVVSVSWSTRASAKAASDCRDGRWVGTCGGNAAATTTVKTAMATRAPAAMLPRSRMWHRRRLAGRSRLDRYIVQPAAHGACAEVGRLDTDDTVAGARVLRDDDVGPGLVSGLPGSRCRCNQHRLHAKADGGRLCYKLLDTGHGGPRVGALQRVALRRGRGRQRVLVG